MNFDIPKQKSEGEQIKKEKECAMYPERAFLGVEKAMQRLKDIEDGKIERLELSEGERVELLKYENILGENLEKIYDIKVKTLEIYPEYFLTNVGRANFRVCTGFDIEAENVEDIEKFFCHYRGVLENLDGKMLAELTGKSKAFSEQELFKKLKQTISNDGDVDIAECSNPARVSIVLNPEKALVKIAELRSFKNVLRQNQKKEGGQGNFFTAKAKIESLYGKRINELIMDLFPHVVRIKKMADLIGIAQLTVEEQDLIKQFSGIQKFAKTFSRYDRLVHGASRQYDEAGNASQVGNELIVYADTMEEKYLENEKRKRSLALEKGIDFEKIARTYEIKKEVFTEYAEKFFANYGQLSSEPAETFSPKRKGPAADNKWQYCPRQQYNSFDVSLDFKIIKAPVRERSMEDLIAILLGHEFTHVVQMFNQEKLPLRLYRKVCGDRRELLLEGGAMMTQNKVTEEIFGYKTFPKVHYVRAMAERQKGGTYLDCVKAYYQSSLKTLEVDENFDSMGDEELRKRREKLLETALKGAKRLFSSGDDFNLGQGVLTKSKDTIYLEQAIAIEKLQAAGMEKYAFIRGLNLSSMAELMEMGFLDEKNIELPDLEFVKRSWEELKADFLIKKES